MFHVERALVTQAQALVTAMETTLSADTVLLQELNDLRAFKARIVAIATEQQNTIGGVGRAVYVMIMEEIRLRALGRPPGGV